MAMDNSKGIYSEIFCLLPSTYLEEITELDFTCKSILLTHYKNNAFSSSPSASLKIQSVLDLMYELINIGNWKEIKLFIRKTITIASYIKLLQYLKEHESLQPEDVTNAFSIIDHGLLFGCPLKCQPRLLQNCATILNNLKNHNLERSKEQLLCIESNTTNCNITKETSITIESINCPSMEYFYTNHIVKEKPVILKNCIGHWPALNNWKDQNYLLQLAGLRTVPVELGTKYTDTEWTQKLMTLEHFIKNHIFNENKTVGYLAQYRLFDQIPELMDDISVPEYCCFSESEEAVDINAWYGPKGTVSPLHHDPKKNLLAQVVGEKKIYLFAPSDSEFVYPHEEELLNNTARVDPRKPDLEKYPDYSKATPYFCVLGPGQLLYIPPRWWHFVESISVSFSVSFWWV